MQNPVFLVGREDGPVGVLAHFERRPQHEPACSVGLAVELRECSSGQISTVLVSDRNALPTRVESVRARHPDRNGQFAPGIHLARRDLDRAGAPALHAHCLCRHGVPLGIKAQAEGSWAAFVPAM